MTLSLLKLSISCLRLLFVAIASLNFWFALSSLFSRILIYLPGIRQLEDTALTCLPKAFWFSAPAFTPPSSCFWLFILSRKASMLLSSSLFANIRTSLKILILDYQLQHFVFNIHLIFYSHCIKTSVLSCQGLSQFSLLVTDPSLYSLVKRT